MIAIKTEFDGEKIVLPQELRGQLPGEVIVLYEPSDAADEGWLKAQEESFSKVWDNDEDAAYDRL